MEELDEILDNPRNHTLVVYEVVMGIQEKFKLIKNQINRWGGKRYVVLGVGFIICRLMLLRHSTAHRTFLPPPVSSPEGKRDEEERL